MQPSNARRETEFSRDSCEISGTINSYDHVAADFAAQWGDLPLEQALSAFAERITGRRRVLDLGCGPGRDVDFMSQIGCRLVGLDLSIGMLSEARCRLPDADLVRADLRCAPFATAAFDGIWACASLLHVPRVQFPDAVAEVARLLRRPGGLFYLSLKRGHGERWVAGIGGRRIFFVYYQPSEVETRLRQAGFQILEGWVSSDSAGREHPWISFVACT
ncbi:MAG: class I SAM-dependent methyltransferase [Anaerolineae bacterium]|jgi:SAM-dependent methyltransferase